MQFNKSITKKERASLLANGVKLIGSFSKNTYFVELTPGFYEKNASNSLIRTVLPYKPEYKIDVAIVNNDIPSYAKEGDFIQVVVSYFKNSDANEIKSSLVKGGFKDFRISGDFQQIYTKIHPNQVSKLANLEWVQNIELISAPDVLENNPGRTSHRANILSSNIAGLGHGLTGNGVKVGIWDGNVEPHKDATGRLNTREYETPSTHGSHVFGTVAGAGIIDPLAKGMAPKATIYAWNFNVQSNRLSVHEERLKSANEDGIELTQNSFGIRNSGGFSTQRYSASDRGEDDVMVKKNYLLTMYSNGNDQSANPQAGGFNTTTKNSKNPLHVGANDPNESMSNYSSFGPSPEGRLFPQISAIGSDVYSVSYNNSYEVMSGTSMATPGVTGTVALLYERYKTKFGQKPISSLMKAIVCNTATEVGNLGPDYKYGFGSINGLKAVETINDSRFYTASIANGETNQKVISVPAGTKQLKVMLCYTDLPGVPGSSSVLVNNLDIKVLRDGVEHLPWVLNPLSPNSLATKGVDNLNNIEQVTIDTPEAGDYTIVVNGKNIPLDTQEFAVTYEFVKPYFRLGYPVGNEKLNPGTTEFIRWEYEGEAKPFVLEYSIDGGNSYKAIAEVPANLRNYAWSVPQEVGSNVKVRIISGSKIVSSKELFTIMNRPTNVKTNTVTTCGVDTVELTWNPVVNAKYEVLKLNANGDEFEKIAETAIPSYTVAGLTSSTVLTVRAIDLTTNAASERAIGVVVNPVTPKALAVNNLPYKEDFESLTASNFTLSGNATGTATLGYWNTTHRNGIVFSGNGVAGTTAWVASSVSGFGATSTCNAFTNNPTYSKKVSFCQFDGTALAGKQLRMSFELRYEQANTSPLNKIFTRVLVNGTELVSHENTKFYSTSNVSSGSRTPIYDLSAYAGQNINVVIETVFDDADKKTATSGTVTNKVYVDNFSIYEAAANDIAVNFASTSPSSLNATSNAVTISASIQNMSGTAISNVPVSYIINEGTPVTEVIAGPIAPMGTLSYNFTSKPDLSAIGAYTIVVKADHPGDANVANNSYAMLTKMNNGADVLVGTATTTTCSAVFTDDGGRFGKYANIASASAAKVSTFVPATAGKKIKVEFTAFDLENGWDYLKVYNGPTKTSPLIGSYTGNTLPSAITSSAAGGELTFEFVPDDAITADGFVATISCADFVSFTDASMVSVKKPDLFGKKSTQTPITVVVKNNGDVQRTNLPVYYQINGGAKVEETIPSVNALSEFEYTFTTPSDLTTNPDENFAYEITAGINETDYDVNNNTKVRKVYNKFSLPGNVNTDGYAITSLNWGDFTNNSGTTGYSDFSGSVIPVFKGRTNNPFVTISKPDLPLTRALSLSSGVFTMMVIDLNNDGNFADEYYASKFWVNTEANDAKGTRSTTGVHYFKEPFLNVGGVTLDATVPTGNHKVRFIHMYRSSAEGYNVVLGPTKDGLTTSRSDFEVEDYTINVQDLPAVDAEVTQIVDVRPRLNNTSDITVKVRNNSATASINNFDVAYKIDNGTEVTQTISTAIATNAEATIVFNVKADLRAIKTYGIEAYTKLAGDLNPDNDKKAIVVNHVSQKAANTVTNFDGVDDVLETRNTPSYSLTNNFTLEAWCQLKQKPTSGFGRVFDKGNILVFAVTIPGHTLYRENSWVISVTTDAGSFALNTDANTVKLGKWQHIAVTSSATNVYKVYIDGVEITTRLASGTATAAVKSNIANALLVGNGSALTRGFVGNIDEVRVWNVERSAADIVNNMTVTYPVNQANMVAYFPMAENEESFVYDKSTNDNTGLAKNVAPTFWETPTLLNSFKILGQTATNYNAATKTFTVYVPASFDMNSAVFDFDVNFKSVLKYNNVSQTNTVTSNVIPTDFQVTVEGIGFNNTLSETYNVKIEKGLNSQSQLLAYTFNVANNAGLASDLNTTISGVNVSADANNVANLTSLVASFQLSPNATLYVDGVKQENGKTVALDYDQKSVVVYVVSEDTTSKTYYEITLNKTLSNDNFDLNALSVYPNPIAVNGKLYVNTSGKAELFDTLGRKVLTVPSFDNSISLDGIHSGNYLLQVTNEKGERLTKKIIIK